MITLGVHQKFMTKRFNFLQSSNQVITKLKRLAQKMLASKPKMNP